MRECRLLPGNILTIKVGMQGRVVLGPEGVPGPIEVQVRYAVVREGIEPRPITTKLDRVRAPIGLEIGAQTPEEIAVAIVAEIIQVRRGGRGLPMSEIARTRELRIAR